MLRYRLLALAVLLTAAAPPGLTAERHGPFPPYILEPAHYGGLLKQGAAHLKKVEIVEMVSAIVSGDDLEPNKAWFHPSQSRYDWKWFAQRYDKNRDGKITEKEWPDEEKSPAAYKLFERLDREGKGSITATDFDWSMRSVYLQQLIMASGALRTLGSDNGGKITREDWERTFERFSKGKGFITPEDLRERMFPPPERPVRPADPDPSPTVLLKGLLQGDLGSPFPGPGIGQRAPDFRLPTYDGKKEIALSDLRGKPVVLVFGSFT
jgi:Ca2+-binding EF-hand superfamily protein